MGALNPHRKEIRVGDRDSQERGQRLAEQRTETQRERGQRLTEKKTEKDNVWKYIQYSGL